MSASKYDDLSKIRKYCYWDRLKLSMEKQKFFMNQTMHPRANSFKLQEIVYSVGRKSETRLRKKKRKKTFNLHGGRLFVKHFYDCCQANCWFIVFTTAIIFVLVDDCKILA